MYIKKSMGEKVFDSVNILFLALLSISVTSPVFHIVAGSLSDSIALTRGDVKLWPVGWNIENYILVIRNNVFMNSFKITAILIVLGTTFNLLMTFITAYPLSRSNLKGRKIFMMAIIFTIIFQAPMIPTYLVVKNLKLIDTLWALILPSAISGFNLIICITFFKSSIPGDLIDAAKVDGMTEYGILWRIVLPLSKPIVMTLLLFYAVHHWNSYQSSMMYITNRRLRPLQLYLYQMLSLSNVNDAMANAGDVTDTTPRGIMMATIVASTVPIVIVYPFIQKYFIKGALLGSVKE